MTPSPGLNRLSGVHVHIVLPRLLVGRLDGHSRVVGERVLRVQWLLCVRGLGVLRWLGWKSGLPIRRRRFWLQFL